MLKKLLSVLQQHGRAWGARNIGWGVPAAAVATWSITLKVGNRTWARGGGGRCARCRYVCNVVVVDGGIAAARVLPAR